MTDDDTPTPPHPGKTIPEGAPNPEPKFDEPSRPAPDVIEAPGRNTEF